MSQCCYHSMFPFLASSVHAAMFSHGVGVLTGNAEAVKDNFKFELCLKGFMRHNKHHADTGINIKATYPYFSAAIGNWSVLNDELSNCPGKQPCKPQTICVLLWMFNESSGPSPVWNVLPEDLCWNGIFQQVSCFCAGECYEYLMIKSLCISPYKTVRA